jgi:hypothetical protein
MKASEPYSLYWVAYFDLLGFKSIVENEREVWRVQECYATALDKIEELKQGREIEAKWFSDTFLLYTGDVSKESFGAIEGASGHFFRRMLSSRIPMRGCLAFSKFYAGPRRELLGPALIAAHRETEAQEWLGFILHPEAANRVREYEINGQSVYDVLLRYDYREYDVAFKKTISGGPRRLVYTPINPTWKPEYAGFLCRDLDTMQRDGEGRIDRQKDTPASEKEAEKERVRRKYENTKRFLLDTVPGLSDYLGQGNGAGPGAFSRVKRNTCDG